MGLRGPRWPTTDQMRELVLQGVSVHVDENRTLALNANNDLYNWCQCDGCTNTRITRYRFGPTVQHAFVESLGLDPQKPFHSFEVKARRLALGYYRVESLWLLSGRIEGPARTPAVPWDALTSFWIQSERPTGLTIERRLEENNLADAGDLLFLVLSNTIPFLFDEVCEFRYNRRSTTCSCCGGDWVDTGFLKRGSRIPDWYGLPELRAALLAKHRVFIAVCLDCGHLSYRIGPDKPPFRTRSPMDRQHRLQRKCLRRSERHWPYMGPPFIDLDSGSGWVEEPWRTPRNDL